MNEQHFASIYDMLMEDVPYDDWLTFAKEHIHPGAKLLDLACGTGTLAIKLYEAGYEVCGADISQDMLTIAENKIRERQIPIKLYHQDMRTLSGLSDLDAVTIFCDGLNYLLKEEDVQQTFKQVASTLRPKGIFLFDVHSPHKMQNTFYDQLYGENGEEVSYLWFTSPGEWENSVEHTLTFFIKEQGDVYRRMDEDHAQRTFPMESYTTWLKSAGFDDIVITADFGRKSPMVTDERYFFTAVKK